MVVTEMGSFDIINVYYVLCSPSSITGVYTLSV